MNSTDENPVFFSVIIATRNRPELFKQALDSVLSQDYNSFDVHVVNDGSSDDAINDYKKIEKDYQDSVAFHYLVHRPNGHGHGYSMNYGVQNSNGNYLCFLDDDDAWVDKQHLSRAAKSIKDSQNTIGLYFTNQKAYFSNNMVHKEALWIEDIQSKLAADQADAQGSYVVDQKILLDSKGFAHLNCSIFLRSLYQHIDGVDESIRYEEDRDIYLRALDACDAILYNPEYVSRHNIPDKKQGTSLSTGISDLEKKLYQLRVYDKGMLLAKSKAIVAFCRLAKANELKNITAILCGMGLFDRAQYYARQAFALRPSFKWGGYTVFLMVKKVLKGQ